MPFETNATAPGKIILFGEHSVVYSRPALAVPVSQVTATCRVSTAPSGHGIVLIAPDLARRFRLADTTLDDPLRVAVTRTLTVLAVDEEPDLILTVASTIPIARGLGSGAAIATVIVDALAAHLGHPLNRQMISEIVFEVEKVFHGTPSGIDNSVVAFAQPIFFIRGQPIIRLNVHTPLTFVIGDTGVQSSTRVVVGDLRRRWERSRERYERYFDQMGSIAHQARTAIEQGRVSSVGAYMTANQGLLEKIGVSSPELNTLVAAAMTTGAWGAKMSGAGWGGNMIALADPDSAPAIAAALREAGAVNTIITTVSGRGT